MATRSVRFPRELLDRLDKEADQRDLSTNWLILKLCQEGLERLDSEFKVTS
jgi:CopG-like RHH_1 or ribbon-helix-helix domain, RHH_5